MRTQDDDRKRGADGENEDSNETSNEESAEYTPESAPEYSDVQEELEAFEERLRKDSDRLMQKTLEETRKRIEAIQARLTERIERPELTRRPPRAHQPKERPSDNQLFEQLEMRLDDEGRDDGSVLSPEEDRRIRLRRREERSGARTRRPRIWNDPAVRWVTIDETEEEREANGDSPDSADSEE